jgi:hypothetical protein
MSRDDYEMMVAKVSTTEDETERYDLQQQALMDFFRKQQEKDSEKNFNPREVSQRKGMITMLQKEREREELGQKNKLDWMFAYNRLEPPENQPYSSSEVKKFISEKGKDIIEKNEIQLADTIIKEYNQVSKDEKITKPNPDAQKIRDLIKSETGSRLLVDGSKSKIIIDDIQKERDILIGNRELKRNELKRIINKYNAYKREEQGAQAMFNNFQGSPEYVDLAMQIRRGNPSLNDKQVFSRVYDRFKVLHAKEIQAAEANRLNVELMQPAQEIPPFPSLKRLETTIKKARAERDINSLNEVNKLINSYKTMPAYAHRQNALENLWKRSESARVQSSGGLAVEPRPFTRIAGSDISGRELNALTKNLSDREKRALQSQAFTELYPIVKPEFLDDEVQRRMMQMLPGAVNVEEKLKGRMGVKDERDFLNKITKLNLGDLEKRYGTEIVADVADKSKTSIIDGIIMKTMPKAKVTSGERALLMDFDKDELLSIAATQGVPIIEEDKISRDEFRAVKQISKIRRPRFK